MENQRTQGWSRREFLRGLILAGTAGLFGLYLRPIAAEPPPETTTIRLVKIPGICIAPQYVVATNLFPLRGDCPGDGIVVC
jgi:hypothetical protein